MPDPEGKTPAQTLTFCPAKNVRFCDRVREKRYGTITLFLQKMAGERENPGSGIEK
jgi:hypothetical protein